MTSRSLLTALLFCLTSFPLTAQHVYDVIDISLTAEKSYDHPIRDVTVECLFTGEQGDTVRQHAFWDGGDTWRIRFSPPYGGTWHWVTSSSLPADTGLHDRQGSRGAVRSEKQGRFAEEGWLQVSPDHRYLVHESGNPYFWLACTAWEITWKSTLDQVEAYLNDRQDKGFTAIQIVVFSHQRIEEFGVRNRNGDPSVLVNEEWSRLNPEYFRYLDTIVSMVNERDMAAVLVPMWAAFSELYDPAGHRFYYSRDEALTIARYVGARYAADNVVWIMGGDNAYDTEEKRELFADFAAVREEAGSPDQLVTIHPHGWSTSFDFFDNTTPWLDFHMYQSSHTAYGDFTWDAAWRGYHRTPPMPVLNGEATYEGIFHNLWTPGDTAHPDRVTWRITAAQVRQASYESILSGALVGITYGGNGVWQWHTPELHGSHRPELFVEEAWQMPGSANMTVLKQIMQKVHWQTLVPRRELIAGKETFEDEYIAIAENDQAIIAYVPENTISMTLAREHLPDTFCYSFVNPVTGFIEPCTTVDFASDTSSVRLIPPDTSDWVLIVDKAGLTDVKLPEGMSHNVGVRPNPIVDQGFLHIELPVRTDVTVEVFSVTGEHIRSANAQNVYSFSVYLEGLVPGSYLYRIEIMRSDDSRIVDYGKFIVVGVD